LTGYGCHADSVYQIIIIVTKSKSVAVNSEKC